MAKIKKHHYFLYLFMSKKSLSSSLKILQQLFILRNITLSFIILMILGTEFLLDFHLPLLPIGLVLFSMICVNIYTLYLLKNKTDASDKLLFLQLLFEVLSITLILYFSGGATNPFTFYYLIPIAIAATVIPGKSTWFLMTLGVLAYSLLLKYYQPLMSTVGHQHDMNNDGLFSQHVLGMWVGFLISAVLVTLFITRLAKELKYRDEAIVEAHENELRYQQMITLGSLAAGTAHELGTPLASLAIITGELTDGLIEKNHPELFINQKIMHDQIMRCKKILSVLSDSVGESRADAGSLIDASDYISQILDDWQQARSNIHCTVDFKTEINGMLLSDKTLSQAFINLFNNAADASDDELQLFFSMSDPNKLCADIINNGVGISDEQIKLAGDVSFSTKPDGMGIGLYLAITSIRRYEGEVNFKRLKSGGTITTIHLPVISKHHG